MSDLTLENYCHQNKIELFFMPFGEAMLSVARLLKLLIYGITSFLFFDEEAFLRNVQTGFNL